MSKIAHQLPGTDGSQDQSLMMSLDLQQWGCISAQCNWFLLCGTPSHGFIAH